MTQPFRRLFTDFKYRMRGVEFRTLQDLREVKKPVGKPAFLPRDETVWMTYENHTYTESPYHRSCDAGTISVTQNTRIKYEWSVRQIGLYLHQLFPHCVWDLDNIHFMRTVGHVLPHVGGTRTTSLNIGLYSSFLGRTEISEEEYKGWGENDKLFTYIAEDGDGYILDVKKPHGVWSFEPTIPRYQITYGFNQPYEEVLAKLLNR